MKIKELINELCNGISVNEVGTCDTVKCGNPDEEIKKVAVTMMATVDVIKSAIEWGANFIITHEPTYYSHYDVKDRNDAVTLAKEKLLTDANITLFRYHDYAHARTPDLITTGELGALGLDGKLLMTPHLASYKFEANKKITALELANLIEKKLNVAHVRIVGERNKKSDKIAACFGTPGGIFELLKSRDIEIMVTGEVCEWSVAEYVRDAAALGINKTIIVLGHVGSERDGMKLLEKNISEKHPELVTKYFECGEVYTYTDSII